MDEVEVYELTQEEWNAGIQKALQRIGLTKAELKKKHSDGTMNAEETKVWMLIK